MLSSSPVLRCQQSVHSTIVRQVRHRGLATHATKRHRLFTGIVLNRSPIITQTPTAFEKAFYDYQARLQRALHNPFPRAFYFRPGSILAKKFRAEERVREREAFGGRSQKNKVDVRASNEVIHEDEEILPMHRWALADETNDLKSLDRQGERNLYLLMRGSPKDKHEWRFPQGNVENTALLHEAAKRDLQQQCGSDMNVWIVGRHPIGFFEYDFADNFDTPHTGDKIFFFKAHILAGQVKPVGKGLVDFAWLTKEEIEFRVEENYWLGIKDMLSDF